MALPPHTNFVIWKSDLKVASSQEIEVPAGAQIICAHEQYDQICIWYVCDPTREKEWRSIIVVGTGHQPPAWGKYLGTAFLRGGELVFHVFEEIRK